MKRPEGIGTIWVARNKGFIHGPRFANPEGFKRIFTQAGDPNRPRYVIGVSGDGKHKFQSVVRKLRAEEWPKLQGIAVFDGQQWVFPGLRISPTIKEEGQTYRFYGLTTTQEALPYFTEFLKKYNFRIKKQKHRGLTLFRIYIRRSRT